MCVTTHGRALGVLAHTYILHVKDKITLIFFVLFLRGLFKFLLNFKHILISLLRLEVIGFSIFMLLNLNFFFFSNCYILVYMCLIVGGSSLGLILLITFSVNNRVSGLNRSKIIIS